MVLYFSTGIKELRENFYNFESEADELAHAIESDATRCIVISGMRRVGKSSIVNVLLNEMTYPYIWVDTRELGAIDVDCFYRSMVDALNTFLKENRGFFGGIKNKLRKIKGFSISTPLIGGGVTVDIEQNNLYIIANVLKILNKQGKSILVIDEAQNFGTIDGFDNILAFIYDNLKNIKMILTGSEINLTDALLGAKNPNAAFFGRTYHEINLSPLTLDKSLDFLKKGFEQENVTFKNEDLEEIINHVDGVTGWLVQYGFYISEQKLTHVDAMSRTFEDSKTLVRGELEKFLRTKKEERTEYVCILKTIKTGAQFDEIKKELKKEINGNIMDDEIRLYLSALERFGFIRKKKKKYEGGCIAVRRAIGEMF